MPSWQELTDDQKLVLEQLDLILWAEHRIDRFDVRAFDIDVFPHLRTIFEDEHPRKVIEKSAQMAITSYCTLEAIHQVWSGKNWLYLFPTGKMLQKYVQPRFDKIVQQNPRLAELFTATNNVNTKQIGRGTIYFSGLGSTTKEGGEYDVLSVAVDGITFDERERMKPDKVKEAMTRMMASPHKIQRRISTPKLPLYGIDEDYQDTDKKVLMMKCPHCGHQNSVDDDQHFAMKNYIDWAMDQIRQGFLACQKCKKDLKGFKGEFVAQNPAITHTSGYHISGLYSPFLDVRETLKNYSDLASSKETQAFWNTMLGFPYVDVKDKLNKEMILQRCTSEPMASSDDEGCFLGVDIGGSRKGIHVVVGKPDDNWDFDILYLDVIHEPDPDDPDFINWLVRKFREICYNFKIKKGVIDAEPSHLSRAIANSIPKMWRCQYSDGQKEGFKWVDADRVVKVNRTESLDNSHDILAKKKFKLRRRCPEIEAFAEHCAALVKDEEVDEDTGQKTYIWKKIAKFDDYRHAENYMVLASGYDGRQRLKVKPGIVTISNNNLPRPTSRRLGW